MVLKIFTVLFVVLSLVCGETNRPIIGILAQETVSNDPNRDQYTSYISASYVKAVESAGARVVPVFIDRKLSYYRDIIKKINGVLYPGGFSNMNSTTGITRSGKIMYHLAMKINQNGGHMPLFGVCEGFELLSIISNNGKSPLIYCNIWNEALPLNFKLGFRFGSVFSRATDRDIYVFKHTPSTAHFHYFCLTENKLMDYGLNNLWRVLSTSKGAKNPSPFISAMQMYSAPVLGTQFHPEKPAFEWLPWQNTPHDKQSIDANRIFYDWFITESLKNNGSFESYDELKMNLIYNYSPKYTGLEKLFNVQDYYFKDPPFESSIDEASTPEWLFDTNAV